MAAIIWTDVTNHYPGMTSVGVDARPDILGLANEMLSAHVFGGEDATKYKMARVHLAAHFGVLELRRAGGAAGPVTSKTVSADSLAVSYGSAATDAEVLLSTVPGTALYTLMRMSPRANVFLPRCR